MAGFRMQQGNDAFCAFSRRFISRCVRFTGTSCSDGDTLFINMFSETSNYLSLPENEAFFSTGAQKGQTMGMIFYIHHWLQGSLLVAIYNLTSRCC